MNVANSWVFWIGLIDVFVALYILPSVIGAVRHVESLALVVILNTIPVVWPAVMIAACLMPRRDDR